MWIKINKPSSQTYTTVNPIGKEQYDQADILYDSATTFYDGVNTVQWTRVNKPATNNWVPIAKPT